MIRIVECHLIWEYDIALWWLKHNLVYIYLYLIIVQTTLHRNHFLKFHEGENEWLFVHFCAPARGIFSHCVPNYEGLKTAWNGLKTTTLPISAKSSKKISRIQFLYFCGNFTGRIGFSLKRYYHTVCPKSLVHFI